MSTVAEGYDGAGPAAGGAMASWSALLASLEPAPGDAGRVDQIRLLEDIKAGCAAAQVRITATFAASQRERNCPPGGDGAAGNSDSEQIRRVGGGPAAQRAKAERLANRSAAAQVALARRESPQRGGRYVGLAEALVHEMPCTLAALTSGTINEWRATIIVRETACLTAQQRSAVDAEIADHLDGLGDARLQALVKAIAYRIDPESAVARAAKAAGDRRVSLRPAPDAMGYLTGLMPIASAVACFAALCRYVDCQPPIPGDARTRDQRIIDEYVRRLTGRATGSRPATSSPAAPDAGSTTTHPDGDTDRGSVPTTAHEATTEPDLGRDGGDQGPRYQTGVVTDNDTDGLGADADGNADEDPDPGVDPVAPVGGDVPTGTDTDSGAGDAVPKVGSTGAGSAQDGPDDPVAAVRASYQRAVDRERRQAEPCQDSAPPVSTAGGSPPHPPPGDTSADRPAAAAAELGHAPTRNRGSAARLATRDPAASEPHDFPDGTGVVINLVITDRTLFGDGDDPAVLPGNHAIPAPLARRMVADLPASARVWIRRLYTRPDTGELVAADSKQRTFSQGMRHLLFTRDGTCRTPWCNAPARHADHITPYSEGGPTSIANGQSLSEDCNYIRTAPGWSAGPDPDHPGGIVVTTPTGHQYPSPVPDLIPGHTRPDTPGRTGHTRPGGPDSPDSPDSPDRSAHPPDAPTRFAVDVRHNAEQAIEYLLARTG